MRQMEEARTEAKITIAVKAILMEIGNPNDGGQGRCRKDSGIAGGIVRHKCFTTRYHRTRNRYVNVVFAYFIWTNSVWHNSICC